MPNRKVGYSPHVPHTVATRHLLLANARSPDSALLYMYKVSAFSALTLLVGLPPGCRKSIRTIKNGVMRCWCGYLSGAKCKWFAYGPADATANPSSLASLKSRMILPLWYRLTQVVLEKRPLNEYEVVVVVVMVAAVLIVCII